MPFHVTFMTLRIRYVNVTNRGQEVAARAWLPHESRHAGFERRALNLRIVFGCECHDSDPWCLCAEPFTQVEGVSSGKAEIEEHNIRLKLSESLEQCCCVGDAADEFARRGEQA
jgi:hypothetical protein